MRYPCALLLLCLGLVGCQQTQPRPEIVPAEYVGLLAPKTPAPLLQKGDRLAICGDSITEQKMYSRLLEAYLAAARPDLQVECRQYGWSGETAGGFFGRMKNDVLRFRPTIASTCYGMNDFRYVPFEKSIGEDYRKNQTKVVQAFKAAGARVVLGSSGTIHSVPPWVKSARGTWETLNLALLQFRNINIEVAEAEQVTFADVYWPMLAKGFETRAKYGDAFKLEGGDGVHPGWAGHVMMAAAYLKALGLDGDLGTVEVDLAARTAQGSAGQRVVPGQGGALTLISDRLPCVFEAGDVAKDSTIAAGLAFGLAATPCTTPVLAVLLAWMAQNGKPLVGMVLLTSFGAGQVVPLLLAGTAAASLPGLLSLRRIGQWVPPISGVVLVTTGALTLVANWR